MKISFIFLALFISYQGLAQGIYTEHEIAAQNLLVAAKKQFILGKIDKAMDIYDRLLKEYNESAAAYELSRIYALEKDYERALLLGKRAYESDRSNKWYAIHYADLQAMKDNFVSAAEIYESLSKTDPSNDYAYLQAGFYYLKAERPKLAIAVLNNMEKHNGITEEVIQRKFEIYDVMGKSKQALAELEKLSTMYPLETKYLHNISGYLRSLGKEKAANKIMEQILQIDPSDETALLFMNGASKNRKTNYLRTLVPIIQDQRIGLDKKIIELIPYLQEFAEKGDPELGKGLMEVSEILDDTYPDNAKVKSILGDIQFYHNRMKAAAEQYAMSIDANPSVWTVWAQLFIALNISKDFNTMKSYSESAMDVYPNQALVYYYNSLALLELGELSESNASLLEAKMIGANNVQLQPELLLLESRLKLEEKRIDEALTVALSAETIKGQDRNHRLLDHIGNVYAAKNLLDQARKYWKKSIDAGGNPELIRKKIKGEGILEN